MITDKQPRCFESAFSDRPHVIEFCLANGAKIALPYSHLVHVTLDSPGQITIQFTAHQVTLNGTNLEQLYEEIKALKIRSTRTTPNSGQQTSIERIEVNQLT